MHNFQYARMHKSLHMDALPARTSRLLALCTALTFAFFPCVFYLPVHFCGSCAFSLGRPAHPVPPTGAFCESRRCSRRSCRSLLVSADLGTDLLGEKHSNVKRRLPEAGQGWPTPGAGIHKMHLISSSEAHRVCLSAVFRSRRSKNKTRTRDLSPPAFVHLQANLLVFQRIP